MPSMKTPGTCEVAVIGAGPAGLFASEYLLGKGFRVSLYDRMASPGCKFLVAGNHGGLNITNDAASDEFAARYGKNELLFSRLLEDFSPDDLKKWIASFGVATHTGSGGKVFAGDDGSVSIILSRWLDRLRSHESFSFHPRHRLVGIGSGGVIRFGTGDGEANSEIVEISPDAALFALGGASWPKTGSDGAWAEPFSQSRVAVAPFLPANCGFEADWSDFLKEKARNVPLKNISMSACGKTMKGELMLTPYGMEGGVVYGLGAAIRDEIIRSGSCTVYIDLMPASEADKIAEKLAAGPGKESLSNWYRKRLGLGGAEFALLREAAGSATAPPATTPSATASAATASAAVVLRDPAVASRLVKHLPVTLYRPRPIGEAISSAGGVQFAGLDENFMLKDFPGWFCAGEMLDWESPTGGFLLQGCFSTAFRAARGIEAWLGRLTSPPAV